MLRALSGPLVPAELISGDAAVQGIAEAAVVRGVWQGFESAIRSVADGTSLQDLLDRRSEAAGEAGFMMNI